MSLPTEWEACPGIEGIEIKVSGGSLLFKRAGGGAGDIVAWWVRPPSEHSTTAVKAQSGRIQHKIGNARTFPKARDLVKAHLDRSKET